MIFVVLMGAFGVPRAPETYNGVVAFSDVTGGGASCPGTETTCLATITIQLEDEDVAEDAVWFYALAWQGRPGGDSDGVPRDPLSDAPGIVRTALEPTGTPGEYRTEDPVPLYGNWKTLLRLHVAPSEMVSFPMYAPDDPAIDGSQGRAVVVENGAAVHTVLESKFLQREKRRTCPPGGGRSDTSSSSRPGWRSSSSTAGATTAPPSRSPAHPPRPRNPYEHHRASYGSVMNTDPTAFKRVLDINVLGVFHTARATLPALVESRGYFLVVSSLAAFAAAPGLAAYNASKAGAEHFANALRLEMHHQGVAVGCAHMSWIDTPLVRDAKKDLSTFGELVSKLPYPLSKTTSVDACVKAFIKGIEKRSRHVYCPGWVGGVGLNRNVVNSATGSRAVLSHVPDLLPRMDAEVAALGRSTSARNLANDTDPAAALEPKE